VGGDRGSFSAVSCATAADCLAIGADGEAVAWNGTRWSASYLAITGASGIDAVSCPSATFCAVAGDGLWTGYGTQWTRDGPPADVDWLAVSCPSATFCAAANGNGYVSEFNGRAWSAPVLIDSDVPGSITVSCVSAARCIAMDGYGEAYEWNGARWTQSRPFSKYASLACVPGGFCMVLDSGAVYTSAGSSWSTAGTGPDYSALGHLSCESASFCMFLETTGATDLYDGKGWRRFPDPVLPEPTRGFPYVPGILACSQRTCVAVLANTPDPVANVYGPATS